MAAEDQTPSRADASSDGAADDMGGQDTERPAVPGAADTLEVRHLGYEQARDELVAIVSRLEGGQLDLEESMRLWERGEALAAHCGQWLDRAEERLGAAAGRRSER